MNKLSDLAYQKVKYNIDSKDLPEEFKDKEFELHLNKIPTKLEFEN